MSWREHLGHEPGAFDFHAALRRIEVGHPESPPLGTATQPAAEPVRLGQTPSASFAGAEISGLSDADAVSRLTVSFFGLWGPQGPLPAHMTEHAHERLRHAGDPTLVRFADVFHHRMLLLFYRAWATCQPTVARDRPESDAFARYVGSLVGLPLDTAPAQMAPYRDAALYYAGWLTSPTRSAEGLRSIIEGHFGVRAEIEEFVGDWLEIADESRWRLGRDPATGSLGSAMLGRRAWSTSHKFRLAIGPVEGRDLSTLLPGSEGLRAVASVVRLYAGDEWEWELRLVLAPSAREPLRLGGGARLGWTTQLGGPGRDDFDLVVDPLSGRTRRISRRSNPQTSSEWT